MVRLGVVCFYFFALILGTSTWVFAQDNPGENYPPSGFQLSEQGVYLYAQGAATVLTPPIDFNTFMANWATVYVPQTLDEQPIVLIWSPVISLDSLVLYRGFGLIGIGLEEQQGNLVITNILQSGAAATAGLQSGDIILAVDGAEVGNSIDTATMLLRGQIGTIVEVTYLRGTQRRTVSVIRQWFLSFEELEYSVEFWDENTILLQPTAPLVPDMYCYGIRMTTSVWCFRVVTELTPFPTTTPTPTLTLTPRPTATPSPTATLTAVPLLPGAILTLAPTATDAQVSIRQIYDPGDISAERVEIINQGNSVSLEGWTIQDTQGHIFTLPRHRMFTNSMIIIYTSAGQNTPVSLYGGLSEAIWGESGDAAILTDPNGVVQSIYRLP
jgi:membrane-associated protease RseP (regulator of RpoE activity)